MHGRGLLPEGSFGQHDGRAGHRKREVGQKSRSIARDQPDFTGLAGRARAKLHHDLRTDEAMVIEQGCIADMDPIVFGANPGEQPGLAQTLFDGAQGLFPDPYRESLPDRPRPAASWLRVGGSASSPAPTTRSGARARMS